MHRFTSTTLHYCFCFALCACSSQPIYVPLPASHPASPYASESPVLAQSNTLAISDSAKVPPHPDWQIPGMRDNELHGHAAGAPSAMDMMGHGHSMVHGDHDMSSGHSAPGMVKMSATADKVDYVPEGAVDPSGHPEPGEHQPEMHLDHTDPVRRESGFRAAPLAPPMDHTGHESHNMPKVETLPEATQDEKQKSEPAPVKHDAKEHMPGHDAHSPTVTPAPTDKTPGPEMDHSHHGN